MQGGEQSQRFLYAISAPHDMALISNYVLCDEGQEMDRIHLQLWPALVNVQDTGRYWEVEQTYVNV